MTTSGAAVVISGQGAAVMSSGQIGQVVLFSIVAFGQTGQVDSTLGGAVLNPKLVEVILSTVCSRVTLGSSVLLLATGTQVTSEDATTAC